MRLRTFRFAISVLIALIGVFSLALPTLKASALSGSDFNAGHIIDDVIFTNSSAMDDVQSGTPWDYIQNFLNSKIPSCDTNGNISITYWYDASNGYASASTPESNGNSSQVTTSRAIYGQHYDVYHGTNIAAAPYTCLNQYVENPSNGQNNLQNPSASISGGQSAAQIIYNAAHAYNISPEVLITTLQKEQGLVTDDWPWLYEYQEAMGFNCPDSGGCSGYAGFYQQVNAAAAQYRNYLNNPNNFNYVVGSNNILYSPYCGSSSNVTIQNQATAALYDYTPYQPDTSVLNSTNPTGSSNGPGGGGDGCATYGNRNFWWYFNSWFGSSLASGYNWQMISQYAYTDSSKTTQVNLANLHPGDKVYIGFTAKNTGNVTWTNTGANPIMVGTAGPLERQSIFSPGSSWLSPTRPALLKESSVAPGQTGTFEFYMTVPTTPGSGGVYNERFNLIANNLTWFNDVGLSYYMSFANPTYTWQMISQYAYTDSSKSTVVDINNVLPGQKMYVGFTAKNTGNMTWSNTGSNAVMVGTNAPMERQSVFASGSGWLSATRPALLKESSVAPGQTGTFEFYMTAPINLGQANSTIYNERFNILANGIAWMNDTGLSYYFNVRPATYSWQLTSQYAYTDNTKTTPVNMASLPAGDKIYVGFTAKNTGDMTWSNTGSNAVMVGSSEPFERLSSFASGSGWLSATRPALMKESTVAPGQTGTFEFYMTVPSNASSGTVYNEHFDPIANNLSWFNDIGLSYYVKVQ